MTRKKNKEAQRENLLKQEKDLLAEVDWDLLEELDLEEEGQAVPMRDQPSLQFKELSPEEARKVIRVDPPNGLLKYVPKR
jgi:hypothetical protein